MVSRDFIEFMVREKKETKGISFSRESDSIHVSHELVSAETKGLFERVRKQRELRFLYPPSQPISFDSHYPQGKSAPKLETPFRSPEEKSSLALAPLDLSSHNAAEVVIDSILRSLSCGPGILDLEWCLCLLSF